MFFLSEKFQPVLVFRWQAPSRESISGEAPVTRSISIRETVLLPDQALLFLNYPPSTRLFTKEDLDCVYLSANSSQLRFNQPPVDVNGENRDNQIVRCPLQPRGFTVSLALKSNGENITAGDRKSVV